MCHEAHEPLSLLAQCDGVPLQMIRMDQRNRLWTGSIRNYMKWDVRYTRQSQILPGRMLLKGPSARSSMGTSQEEIATKVMEPLLGVGGIYSIKHGIELL